MVVFRRLSDLILIPPVWRTLARLIGEIVIPKDSPYCGTYPNIKGKPSRIFP
ncbi:protein of unknown function [Pseudodesulfovibrio profundus]|uniref:Uncharacterized protein n=1 Tax=Pseudodesulfovibrio profundus TaxID=57320 RepID=A0A2C8FC54_9BACT|nr:protein of unknown function [Pseudodesulfovibrio profundus]